MSEPELSADTSMAIL